MTSNQNIIISAGGMYQEWMNLMDLVEEDTAKKGKKVKKNNGELPQYYVENGHAPIIIPADWDVVQEEIARRKEAGKAYSSATVLSSKLICEDCGGFFGIKVWNFT